MNDKNSVDDCCSLSVQSPHYTKPPKPKALLNRRKFAAASVAAPFVMTVLSRPVWAGFCSPSGHASGPHSGVEVVNCEGLTPGYWKRHVADWTGTTTTPGWEGAATGDCSPLSPGNQNTSTCKVYLNNGLLFDDVFPGGYAALITAHATPGYWVEEDGTTPGYWVEGDFYLAPGSTETISLMQVLWLEKSAGTVPVDVALAFHLVAAWLNAGHFGTEVFGLSQMDLVNLYHSVVLQDGSPTPDWVMPGQHEVLKDMLDDMNNGGLN